MRILLLEIKIPFLVLPCPFHFSVLFYFGYQLMYVRYGDGTPVLLLLRNIDKFIALRLSHIVSILEILINLTESNWCESFIIFFFFAQMKPKFKKKNCDFHFICYWWVYYICILCMYVCIMYRWRKVKCY